MALETICNIHLQASVSTRPGYNPLLEVAKRWSERWWSWKRSLSSLARYGTSHGSSDTTVKYPWSQL